MMQYDSKKPEDVVKVNANEYGFGGDDGYDAIRYGANTHLSTQKLPKKKVDPFSGEALLKQAGLLHRLKI
jgi:hypothetical protein